MNAGLELRHVNRAWTKSVPNLRGHIAIMRVDHWIKNVFVVPGIVVALAFSSRNLDFKLLWTIALALGACCIVASSYYTLNELLDASYDRNHPTKRTRPVVCGQVNKRIAFGQWLALGALGIGLGFYLSRPVGISLAVLWGMGIIYNVPPVRTKDLPYFDVVSEAVNNPLRLAIGFFAVTPGLLPPASLILSYWFFGAYLMAIKRFAEYKEINDPTTAASYRASFRFYSEQRLLTSVVFYGSTAMLFLGAFTMRYHLELVLAYPTVAFAMAVYFDLAFQRNSPAQAPEKLYREPLLVIAMTVSVTTLSALCFVDLPWLHNLFVPSLPFRQ